MSNTDINNPSNHMQQITIKDHTYAVVDMQQHYPFASLTSPTQQILLVRKKLLYQNTQQLQIINKMSDILYSLQHQHLIAFVHSEETTPNICSFFYEYVPLTIDKWLLQIGEQLVDQLQFELTSLAGYLASNGVKFSFDASCVGLSKDIKIKYFLKQFIIDNQNKLNNYKDNQHKIAKYFTQLKHTQPQTHSSSQEGKTDRNSFQSNGKVDSFETTESWGIKSCHSDGSNNDSSKIITLSERIQDTKKRSLQLLARIKGLKGKPI